MRTSASSNFGRRGRVAATDMARPGGAEHVAGNDKNALFLQQPLGKLLRAQSGAANGGESVKRAAGRVHREDRCDSGRRQTGGGGGRNPPPFPRHRVRRAAGLQSRLFAR